LDDRQIRADIVEIGRRLYRKGLIAANEGNISVREGDVLYVTPAGVCKGFLAPETVVRTNLRGQSLNGYASTEVAMHVSVYHRRPDVRAVVHAHPVLATGFAVAGVPLDEPLLAEAVAVLGPVPVVPYGTPGTNELAETVDRAIVGHHALLLANHGALTVGDTLLRAWERMETLEHLAGVALTARLLGRRHPLPAWAVDRLRQLAGY
jgi:L-fuculose-phosphate aldolase